MTETSGFEPGARCASPRAASVRALCAWLGMLGMLAAAAPSCGGTSLDSGTDTSTNWLAACASDSDCDAGSTCSCGRCTLECMSDTECSAFSESGACTAVAGDCGETRLCMPRQAELGSTSAASAEDCTHPANDYILSEPALCFGRELPPCPPGSTAFFDACGCGCSAAPEYPRRCRDQCELAGSCEELSFEEYPDYDTTLQRWSSSIGSFAGLVAGECENDGRRFIYTANGTTAEARLFTADGLFLGLGTSTDDIDDVCWGQGYWPEPVRCTGARVTRVLSAGLGLEEGGQIVELPWGDGPPEPLF